MSTFELAARTARTSAFDIVRQRELTRRAIASQSFCTLASVSAAQQPHVAGVRYVQIGSALYLTMFDDSVKARNLGENPRVAICIPVRTYPLVPPYTIQFQGVAELLPRTDPRTAELFDQGRLKTIVSSKDYANPRTMFARIVPGRRVSTYGIGVSLLQIAREPTSAIRSFAWHD